MKQYLDLLEDILDNGTDTDDRTGTGARKVFGREMRFDLGDGFPLVTTKKIHFKSVLYELLWFVKGRNDVSWLQERGVRIWNEWQDEDGTIGPGYGYQWRSWPTYDGGFVDQLQNAVDRLKTHPYCRRNIVSAWNVGELDKMVLPPCHLMFQFDVADGRLNLGMIQRSCDMFLGVPYNVASYSTLTMMVAKMVGLEPGEFVWYGLNCHIYRSHFEQVKEQLTRNERPLPQLKIDYRGQSLDDWEYGDFELVDYNPHPTIKAKVAV